MKKIIVFGALLLVAPACRTTTASGPTDGEMSELEAAASGTRVLSFDGGPGSAAATTFEKMMVEEVVSAGGNVSTKSRSGRLAINCTRKGGLPPGAQGFPGPMSAECTAQIQLPVGTMGFPSPGFLRLDGEAGLEVYDLLQAEAKRIEPTKYEKYVSMSTGTFSCKKKTASPPTPPRFTCFAKGTVEANPGPGTQGGELLSLKGSTGSSAEKMYNATNLPATVMVGATTKSHNGRLNVFCTSTGLPPGTQGFPGPVVTKCSASVPLPTGAQGFPAPAFMSLTGTAALDFYNAFKPVASWSAQGHFYEKSASFQSGGKFTCVKKITFPKSYECTISAP